MKEEILELMSYTSNAYKKIRERNGPINSAFKVAVIWMFIIFAVWSLRDMKNMDHIEGGNQ